jgi:O-antigen/teichoic acid export membrane protein
VKRYYDRIRSLAFSATIKDTAILFVGSTLSAFWGFLFTLFIARAFSVALFGIFSAALNLVTIIASLSDLGISGGAVNFVASHIAKGEHDKANRYIKASFIMRLIIILIISLIVVIFAPFISTKLLATRNPMIAIWSAILPIFLFPDMFFPSILRAKNKFLHSTVIDNVFYLIRFIFVLVFYLVGGLTISVAFWAFGAGFIVEVILILYFLKADFLKSKPQSFEYKNLIKFSGWLGVNTIVSSISGRVDVQMIAAMLGAVSTGIYSIPSRLTGFITVLISSFSSVLAPRFASFDNKEKEKSYLIKSTLAVVPIAVGIVFWILIAKPFILFLFGTKYLPSVPIFQALAASFIPGLFTVPSVTVIIYAMKKTVFIGAYSFFGTVAVLALDLFLIPRFGLYGPTITSAITGLIFVIYTWVIVIKHYWFSDEK